MRDKNSPPAESEGRGGDVGGPVGGPLEFWERVFLATLLKFSDMGVKYPIPPATAFADEALCEWLKRWSIGSWGPFLQQQKAKSPNANPAPPSTPPEAKNA